MNFLRYIVLPVITLTIEGALADVTLSNIGIELMDVNRNVSEWDPTTTVSNMTGHTYAAAVGFNLGLPDDQRQQVLNIKISSEKATNDTNSRMDVESILIEAAQSYTRSSNSISQIKVGYQYLDMEIPIFDETLSAHGLFLGYAIGFSLATQLDLAASIDFFAGDTGKDEGYITGPRGDLSLIWTLDRNQHTKLRAGYRYRRYGISENDTRFGERFIDDLSGPFLGLQYSF